MQRRRISLGRAAIGYFAALALSGAVPGVVAEALAQELVVNGSFEEPQLAPGTWFTLQSILGWRLASGHSIEIQNHVAGEPADGNQLVELDSYASSAIYQDIPTVPGATYRLSLSFSPRPGRSASDNVLEIYWDGRFLDSQSRPGDSLSNTRWTRLSYMVTAASSLTRLELRDVGVSNGYGTYVDAVSLQPQ